MTGQEPMTGNAVGVLLRGDEGQVFRFNDRGRQVCRQVCLLLFPPVTLSVIPHAHRQRNHQASALLIGGKKHSRSVCILTLYARGKRLRSVCTLTCRCCCMMMVSMSCWMSSGGGSEGPPLAPPLRAAAMRGWWLMACGTGKNGWTPHMPGQHDGAANCLHVACMSQIASLRAAYMWRA